MIRDIRLDMLELLGSGYVIEHCVAAFSDLLHKKSLETYITDCLMYIAKNSALQEKQYLTTRFYDMAYKPKEKKQDNRTGEQIISSITGKLARIAKKEVRSREYT